jgi:hypothetical protein
MSLIYIDPTKQILKRMNVMRDRDLGLDEEHNLRKRALTWDEKRRGELLCFVRDMVQIVKGRRPAIHSINRNHHHVKITYQILGFISDSLGRSRIGYISPSKSINSYLTVL